MPRDDLAAVEVVPAVAVAVDRQQHLGLDLREAVDHRARAELGRRARPHGADRGGGQEGRDRLGDVGHVGGDAVARAHAERPQPGGDPRRSARAARPRSTATARAARRRGGSPRRRRRGRGRSARRRSAARPGTTRRRASRGARARARTARRPGRRRTPRPRPRSPRGPRPTSATARRSRPRARRRARSGRSSPARRARRRGATAAWAPWRQRRWVPGRIALRPQRPVGIRATDPRRRTDAVPRDVQGRLRREAQPPHDVLPPDPGDPALHRGLLLLPRGGDRCDHRVVRAPLHRSLSAGDVRLRRGRAALPDARLRLRMPAHRRVPAVLGRSGDALPGRPEHRRRRRRSTAA